MNPRIASIENLIARDPGGRNVFGLVVADQLRLAAQSLRLARRVALVSGFFIPEAGAGETDGPPGARVIGDALRSLGISIDFITDERNAPLFRALGIEPLVFNGGRDAVATACTRYLDEHRPTHLLSIERVGRGVDGRYRNMKGQDISDSTAPLDELFVQASRRGLTTIGIGDGGNEIGMGRVFADALASVHHGPLLATIVPTDFCLAAGVSNWGALGLVGALSVLEGRDLLPSGERLVDDVQRMVSVGGAVDGVTGRREATIDGLALTESVRVLEEIRHHVSPSPFDRGTPLTVGVLGFGVTGRAAVALLQQHGHRVRVSDMRAVTLDPGMIVDGVETGAHTLAFFKACDVVVVSPGIRADLPIREMLHHASIPIMSALEMAFAFCGNPVIAVTGTIGKRTTVELAERLFRSAGRAVAIGGNRGTPLAAMLLDPEVVAPSRHATIALAVSSFQLETIVHFRPHIAIMLNIDEAHLDRHRTVAEYVRIKSRIFMNHHPDDVLILNYDDLRLRPLARKHHGRTFYVSTRQAVDRGAWIEQGVLHLNTLGPVEALGTSAVPFPEDLLSALLAARLSGIDADVLATALRDPRVVGTSV